MGKLDHAATYEGDFYAWAVEQGQRIRAVHIPGLDTENIAEEIETLGRSEKRELASRLEVLLMHLLKWQTQPERRGESWRSTIDEQRRSLGVVLRESPSLRPSVPQYVADAFRYAVRRASQETKLPLTAFPAACPWAQADILDEDWLPTDAP